LGEENHHTSKAYIEKGKGFFYEIRGSLRRKPLGYADLFKPKIDDLVKENRATSREN